MATINTQLPPGVDPLAELAVRTYLIERYKSVVQNPVSSRQATMPVLDLHEDDIAYWDVTEVQDFTTPIGVEVHIKMNVFDPLVAKQAGVILKIEWKETEQTVIDTLALLLSIRNGPMERHSNPLDPTSLPNTSRRSKDPTTWPQIHMPHMESQPLNIKHNIRLDQMVPSPLAKKGTILPWRSPETSVAYRCSCSAGLFCSAIVKKIHSDLHPDLKDVLKRTGSIEFGIPLFGHVLHRVHIRLEEVENNWSEDKTRRFEISAFEFTNPLRVVYVEIFGNEEAPNIFINLLQDLERLIKSHPRAQDKIKDTMRFIDGEANLICKHTRVTRQGKPAQHNFGTNRHLQAWHREAPPGMDLHTNRVYANVHCQLTYGECYWCYRNNDLALVMPLM